MIEICFSDEVETQKDHFFSLCALVPFFKNGNSLNSSDFPKWGMSTKLAGNMKFHRGEKNDVRKNFFEKICGKNEKNRILSAELYHSKKIILRNKFFERGAKCDGIITQNKNLIPTVTVADCVPIFILDSENLAFCSLHSGWKGTGIVQKALRIFKKRFKSKTENLCVAIGAHIQKNYFVPQSRAEFFAKKFGKSCIFFDEKTENPQKKYRISLLRANENLILGEGIPEKNIVFAKDCTFYQKNSCGEYVFSSFRREKNPQNFLVQAAFCGYFS